MYCVRKIVYASFFYSTNRQLKVSLVVPRSYLLVHPFIRKAGMFFCNRLKHFELTEAAKLQTKWSRTLSLLFIINVQYRLSHRIQNDGLMICSLISLWYTMWSNEADRLLWFSGAYKLVIAFKQGKFMVWQSMISGDFVN